MNTDNLPIPPQLKRRRREVWVAVRERPDHGAALLALAEVVARSQAQPLAGVFVELEGGFGFVDVSAAHVQDPVGVVGSAFQDDDGVECARETGGAAYRIEWIGCRLLALVVVHYEGNAEIVGNGLEVAGRLVIVLVNAEIAVGLAAFGLNDIHAPYWRSLHEKAGRRAGVGFRLFGRDT